MPLAIGNKKIESLYFRNNNIAKAYRGETLVFQAPAGPEPTDTRLIVMAAGANDVGQCSIANLNNIFELTFCNTTIDGNKLKTPAKDVRAGARHACVIGYDGLFASDRWIIDNSPVQPNINPCNVMFCGSDEQGQQGYTPSSVMNTVLFRPLIGCVHGFCGMRSSAYTRNNVTENELYVCGENSNFMLGLGTQSSNPMWTSVPGTVSGIPLHQVHDCVFGYGFMHLIVGDDRHTEFCGLSATGQSGSGNLSMIQKITPSGLSNVKELKAGYLSSWALFDDAAKTLMFTGLTQYGEGGCGQITGGMPAKTTWFPTLTGVTAFDSARKFTGNAINYSAASVGGQLKVTGSVACGQFGNGKNADQSYLWKDVAGIKNVTSIACGDEFLAVIDGGLLKVAGKNVKGVFGDPNLTIDAVYSTFQTIPIPGGRRPVKVVAGSETLYVLVEAIDDDLTGWRVYP